MGIFGKKADKEILKATKKGDIFKIKSLLEEDTNLDLLNAKTAFDGDTPLHLAIREGHTEIAKFLLSKGTDVHARNASGMSPLSLAINYGRLEIFNRLISLNADIHDKDEKGTSMLLLALIAHPGGPDLKEEGFQLTTLDKVGDPTHKTQIVRLLIEKGVDVNQVAQNGVSPLHWAALIGNKELVELLISKGANVNAITFPDQKTPLDYAQEQKVIETLISKGAKKGKELKRDNI